MLRLPFILVTNLYRFLSHLLASALYRARRAARRGKKLYVTLDLEPAYPLGTSKRGLARWRPDSPSFIQLREDFKLIAADPGFDGVLLRSPQLSMGLARSGDLGDLVDGLRAAGKHVVVHSEMMTTGALRALSGADDVLLTPAGRLYTFGLRFEQLFAKKLLDRLGLRAQFIHIGPFKTATHRFHKERPTPAQDLMMRDLHADLTEIVVEQIASRSGSTPEKVDRALARAPLAPAHAARQGLVSGSAYRADVPRWIARNAGLVTPSARSDEDPPPHPITTRALAKHLASAPGPLELKPLRPKKRTIAVLDLSGTIVGDSGNRRSGQIQPKPVLEALARLRRDPRVGGILVHINSPGGSALSSDLIWEALRRTRSKIPIVAYCSDVAASGGYYIAVGCDHIVCRPETITGSIGVITGTFAVGQALEHLGVHVDSIHDHDNTAMNSLYSPLSDHAMSSLREDARTFYRRFLDRVGSARDLDRRRLHRYARGRVYTGREAYQRGLVDQLGGFEDAIAELARRAEIEHGTEVLSYVPLGKPSLRDLVTGQLSMSAREHIAPVAHLADLYADARTLAELTQREPTLALLDLAPKLS